MLTIPGEAIVPDPQGAPTVFVYSPDRKRVYARRVEVGPPVGKKSKSAPACGAASRSSWPDSRKSGRAAWSKLPEVDNESGTRLVALSASHDCSHDHAGR